MKKKNKRIAKCHSNAVLTKLVKGLVPYNSMFFSLLILAFFSFFEDVFSHLLRSDSSKFIAAHYAARIKKWREPNMEK